MTEISSESMIAPGDVVIDEITLRSYTGFTMSLKGIFHNFIIYENIYSNCMSGSITIVDSLNLAKHFPVIGAETLTISYKTPMADSKMVRLVFRTYGISVLSETAQETTQMLRIEFVSHHAIKNIQTRISKSYMNMPVSNMVNSIFDEYLAIDNDESNGVLNSRMGNERGNLRTLAGASYGLQEETGNIKVRLVSVTETADVRSYIIPNWNPVYAINWLAHRARAKTNSSMCDYVFFQNSDGHHFVPLSELKLINPAFIYTNYPDGFRSENGKRMIESELRNIHEYKIEDISNRITDQTSGMFGSITMTHDITNKQWSTTEFNYDDFFQKNKINLEKYPIIPTGKLDYTNSSDSYVSFYPKNSNATIGLNKVHEPEEIIPIRRSLLNQINSINLVVKCFGDTNVKVGQVISFRTVSKEATKTIDNYENDYLKGNYLVTTVKHVVEDRSHTMIMTLSRDSFAEPLADKKNTTIG